MIRNGATLLALASTLVLGGCLDEWLTTEPQTILTDEQLWNDPQLVTSVLADYYDRIPIREGPGGGGQTGNWGAWGDFDEAFLTQQAGTTGGTYGYGNWGAYESGTGANAGRFGYALQRDIHVALAGVQGSTLLAADKTRALAELRFLRAWHYFELVKRHGGVPIITEELVYDFSGDTESLRKPRAAEAEVYDFVWSELEAIKGQLPNSATERTRATRGAVLALQSRAMLYAASIARHDATSDIGPIQFNDPNTAKLILGIPASRATEFYQRSLAASQALLGGGTYSLVTGADPSTAFNSIFVTENHNEVILAKDYVGASPKVHWFGMRGRPSSMKVDQFSNWAGSEITAVANVAENFDRLNGQPGTFTGVGDGTVASQANWQFFNEIDDIYEGRDGRLFGTLLVPGRSLGASPVDLQAGVYVWNQTAQRYDRVTGSAGSRYAPDNGLLTGFDGPFPTAANKNGSGLFIKKYLNPDPTTARYSPGDGTWHVFFRLGEIYMNAAEAALQLNQTATALGYINTLRQRAGFPANSLTTLSMAKIQQERWSELAYEDHRLWDLKRWRIAHRVFDGQPTTTSARLYVMFPYRIYRPGHPNHNKYVYDRFITVVNNSARHFREGNYYSALPQGAINNNPALVQNPIQE